MWWLLLFRCTVVISLLVFCWWWCHVLGRLGAHAAEGEALVGELAACVGRKTWRVALADDDARVAATLRGASAMFLFDAAVDVPRAALGGIRARFAVVTQPGWEAAAVLSMAGVTAVSSKLRSCTLLLEVYRFAVLLFSLTFF